jgi:rod shape-determining protein MreD
MKIFINTALFMLLVAIQSSSLGHMIAINEVIPDLLLIFVVHIAIRKGAVAGVYMGFITGLSIDIYGPINYLGGTALAMSIVGYIVGLLDEKFLKLSFITKVAVLGISFFMADLFYSIAVKMDQEVIGTLLFYKSLPEGLYTLVVGSLVFYLLHSQKTIYEP